MNTYITNAVLVAANILIAAASVLAQPAAAVRSIDGYTRSVDAIVKRSPRPDLIFADVSNVQSENPRAEWRKFASAAALEKFRKRSETYTVANNWQRNGKIVMSAFTLFSPSGDWAKYVYAYFREDGSLAKAEIDYRTFNGNFILLQNIYFDRTGKILKTTARYRDLTTQKPIKPGRDAAEASKSMLAEKDYFLHTSQLPYAALVRRK